MQYIRDTYNVPAKRGMGITYQKCGHGDPRRGWIVGSRGQYLRVRFAGNLGLFTLHPTWNIIYDQHNAVTKGN